MTALGSAQSIIVTDVAELCSIAGVQPVESSLPTYAEDWSVEPEIRALLVGIALEPSCRTVVEIGSYRGKTVIALAKALTETGGGRAYAVERSMRRSALLGMRARLQRLPIKVIAMSSQRAFANWGREPIDLLVIDGDHSFLQAFIDIAMWSSLLAPHGWMVVHDTVTRLERRFPADYFTCPGAFDITNVVGMTNRRSHHAWEGVAIARWARPIRPSVEKRLVSIGKP